jgi:regulator of sirC expression with transglutaminase-like and TPR domain
MKEPAGVIVSLLLVISAASAFAADPCADPALIQKATGAESMAKAKQYPQAEAAARAVVAVCPNQPVAIVALGQALAGQKKYDASIATLSSAIAVKPDLAYAYFWRGQAYYGLKQKDKMVVDFTTFLKLAPTAPEASTVKQLLGGIH